MSTNGNGRSVQPGRALVRTGGSSPTTETKGLRLPPEEDEPITPGELAYPIGGDPWMTLGQQDPSLMQSRREVSLADLKRMTTHDGHARAMLNMISLPIRAAKQIVEPDEDGEMEAEFIDQMLHLPPHRGGMTTPMSYVLASHALAVRDGFKVFEKVVDVIEFEGRQWQVLRKLKPLPSDTILFRYDDFGGLAGVQQTIYWKGEKKIIELPPEKVLVYTVGKEESPLEGESAMLPAYYHYDKKHRLYYISHIAAQLCATGVRVGKAGASTQAVRQKFFDSLRNLGLNGTVVAPAGFEVDFHTIPAILDQLLHLIEHHDMAMSKSILAHFMDIGSEGKGQLGTATTTSELGDLFITALEAHLDDIAQGFNAYVIPYFIDVNFGSGKYPTFKFEPFSDESKALIAEAFKGLFNAATPPVGDMLFEIQKQMADVLGLEGIDWDELKKAFDEEEKRKQELKEATDKATLDLVKNPPPPEVKPNTVQNPSKAKPIGLAETEEAMARALSLAEASLKGNMVTDSKGRPVTVGDRVIIEHDTELGYGEGGTIYLVKEVLGSSLILNRYIEDGSDDAYNPGPRAAAASSVTLLA